MSIGLLSWAFEQDIKDPLAKFLLTALADRADKESHQCWPSLARLERDTGMSHASIARKLKLLEQLGYIRRTQRSQRSTLYTLLPGKKQDQSRNDGGSQAETTQSHTETHPSLHERHEPKEGTQREPTSTLSNTSEPSEREFEAYANERFEEFYSIYPKHIGRGSARLAMKRAMKKATAEEIVAGAKRFASGCVGIDVTYIPSPERWLDGERWEDDDTSSASTWGNLQ